MEKVTKTELQWHEKYNLLKAYVTEHHHLPDKKKQENRKLVNWWKYNKRCAKNGTLSAERKMLLQELSDMREEHYLEF